MSRETLKQTLEAIGRGHILEPLLRIAQQSQTITRAAHVRFSPDDVVTLAGLENRYFEYLDENRNNGIWLSDALIDFMAYTRVITPRDAQRRPTPLILLCGHWEILENNLNIQQTKTFHGILPQMVRAVTFEASPNRQDMTQQELGRQLSGNQLLLYPQNSSALLNIRKSIFQRIFDEPIPSDDQLNSWTSVVGPSPAPSRCLLIPQNNRTNHWWTIIVLYDEVVGEYVVAYYDSLAHYLSREDHVNKCIRVVDALVAMRIVDSSILATIQTYPQIAVAPQKDGKTCGFQFVDRAIAVEAEILRWPVDKPMSLASFSQLEALKPKITTEACARGVEGWMDFIETYLKFFPLIPRYKRSTRQLDGPLPYYGPIDASSIDEEDTKKK